MWWFIAESAGPSVLEVVASKTTSVLEVIAPPSTSSSENLQPGTPQHPQGAQGAEPSYRLDTWADNMAILWAEMPPGVQAAMR